MQFLTESGAVCSECMVSKETWKDQCAATHQTRRIDFISTSTSHLIFCRSAFGHSCLNGIAIRCLMDIPSPAGTVRSAPLLLVGWMPATDGSRKEYENRRSPTTTQRTSKGVEREDHSRHFCRSAVEVDLTCVALQKWRKRTSFPGEDPFPSTTS